jgi:hypothetical protein
MRVMAKWLVMVVTFFVMVGIELPPFADAAGKELSFAKTSSDSLRIRDLCAKSLEPG